MILFPTLRGYRREWLRPDVIAGLAAGAVVIPQAMAYATVAGMPVQVGLYTCMIPMLAYAAIGGSRPLSVSTTSTVATLTAAALVAGGSGADLATLVLEVGAILLLARLCRLGSLVENINVAVLTGVKTGVGLTIAVGQLPKLLGYHADTAGQGFLRQLWTAGANLGSATPAAIAVSAVLLAILLGLGRLAPKVPAALVAVAVAIAATGILDLPAHGVALISPIPRGLPVPAVPPLAHAASLLPGAFAVALMAFLESISAARSTRRTGDPVLDNDCELAAVGAANTAGAFVGALPAGGGLSQTAVNDRAGARTQAASLVTVLLAVAVALFLAPVLNRLPQAALAAVVVVAAGGLIRPAEFARLARINRVEFWVAAVTAGVALTVGLLAAVAVGVAGTLVLVLRELDRPTVYELRRPPGGGALRIAQPHDPTLDRRLVLRLGTPLYTANVRAAQRAMTERVGDVDVLVLDMGVQGALSVTVLDALQELDQQLAGGGVQLLLAGLPPRALETARRTRWFNGWERAGRVRPTVEDALV